MNAISRSLLFPVSSAAVLVIAVVFARLLIRVRTKASLNTYEAVPELLSPAERSFFGVLQQVVASEYLIFAKVRLADVVRPVRGGSRSVWQSAFNRISGKHVDLFGATPCVCE